MQPPNRHFTVSKDELSTKEGTGKSMKNLLYALWYAKRHLLDQSDVEQRKIKCVALAIAKLCWSEAIKQAGSKLVTVVSQSVE